LSDQRIIDCVIDRAIDQLIVAIDAAMATSMIP
jgi:hypothetical protein